MTDPYDRNQLARDIEALDGLAVFVAYNANVDAIVRVDTTLESFLERPEDPGSDAPPSQVGSKRELATAITHTMVAGRGDQVILTDEFAQTLEATLTPEAQQMGGQAGIMTNLLTSLGAAPLTYTYLMSDRQLSQFTHPERVRYPRAEEGVVSVIPMNEAINTDRTKINWVFEFRAGDELFGVRAQEDTRLIAASRPPEFDLVTGELDTTIDQVGSRVEGALLAGYHNLTPDHVESYDATQRHARDVLRRLRSGGELKVHVEYAVTHDVDLRESMFEWILPEADVIGLDTHELGLLYRDAELDVVEEVPSEATPFDVEEILAHYRMLSALRELLDVQCMRIHAMEYHLAVTESYLSPDAIRRGLEFSAVNAATKAARGDITAPGDLETGLEFEPSEHGLAAIECLADHLGRSTDEGRLCAPTVVACPNRVVADPVRTVGIGDTVSAASFVLEIAVDKESEPKGP